MKMLPCRDVTRLVSQGLDRELALRDRVALRLHFVICTSCRNFNHQMAFLRRAVHRLPEAGDGGVG